MPTWLLKLMPLRDWGYAAIALGAVIFYNVHVHNLIVAAEHRQLVAVEAASTKAKADAQLEIDADKADYATKLAAAEKTYEQKTQADVDAHNADVKRLQSLANRYRDANAALRSAGSAGEKPDSAAGSGSLENVGQLPEFALVSLGLADALRFDDNLLNECRAERDALTGK